MGGRTRQDGVWIEWGELKLAKDSNKCGKKNERDDGGYDGIRKNLLTYVLAMSWCLCVVLFALVFVFLQECG